ncbi:aldehyde dehydrogenase [Actinocorallia populi]|uniref:aldehyde dehydrogenase n=1 Tax=Actinocorallia populi TaxID=2079200 RepID=UPI000D08B15B|nr:aldehyde dehydrogenase [Actinocorallia populi]
MQVEERVFIGGAWVPPSTGRTIEVISPHTEQAIARIAAPAAQDADAAVAAARAAFDQGPWPHLPPADRIAAIRRLADLYDPRREDIARLISAQMGAPITFARSAHAALPGVMMRAFADIAETMDWEQVRPGRYGSDILLQRTPVGVVAAIVPWNMPTLLAVMKLIPALLAGCPVVLKPSPETPLDAYLLAGLTEQAGFPPGVISVLPGDGALGAHLVGHPGVDRVSFTGSTAVGAQVAAACGAALKRVNLELGGKSAAIVLDDADPATTAAGIKVAGLMNSGQACVAQTRILVPRSRHDEHVDALAAMMDALVVADPADPATEVGPLVSRRQQERVRAYIELGEKEGAALATGGAAPPAAAGSGWYIRPTLFARADNGSRIAQEEIFGPVLTVIPYDDEDHAVHLANDTRYGLSGSVWTPDTDHGLAVARRVAAGTFGVNQPYSMDPAAPFGGVKDSGIGRELGPEGIEGHLDTKSISVAAP